MIRARVLMETYPRLCVAGGLLMAGAAALAAMVIGGLITAYAFSLTVPLLLIMVGCKLMDKHLEFQIIENIYGWYRVLLKVLAVSFMLVFFLTVTQNRWAALLLTSLILWAGGFDLRSVRWRVLALGTIFLGAMTTAFPELNMAVLYLMLIFGSGILLILYGIQYQEKRGMASSRAAYDLTELGMLITAGTVIPVLLGFGAAWPWQTEFMTIRKQYNVFREVVEKEVEVPSGLVLDIGILIVLIFALVIIWRKMLDRKTEERAPISEEIFGVIGRKRSLKLEPRRARRYPDSWAGKVIRQYYEFQDFLRGQGIRREPFFTPAEFSVYLQERDLVTSEDIQALTHAFLRARFSLHELTEEDFRDTQKTAGIMRARIRREAQAVKDEVPPS